jgi:formylglycine-generating enzyme required for sulfatase activity
MNNLLKCLPIILCLMPLALNAQCFEKYSKQGTEAFNKKEYQTAIDKWRLALKCSDKPNTQELNKKIETAEAALKPKASPTKPSNSPKSAKANTATSATNQSDMASWDMAKRLNTVEAYETYLDKYPQGIFVQSARQKIQNMPSAPAPAPQKPTYTEGSKIVEPEMIFVEGSTYNMGNDKYYADEKPVHKVKVNSFSISKFEITQAQWKSVMTKLPVGFDDASCDNCPINFVSWTDAQEFIQKLNQLTGKKYRLPTEAQWEFAAKGGKKNTASFDYAGNNNLDKVAWHTNNSDTKLNEVGKKIANELGIYDMSGNVREWCRDIYDENYYQSSTSDNPQGPTTGSMRVFRGGSYTDDKEYLRVSIRVREQADFRDKFTGFRVVKE